MLTKAIAHGKENRKNYRGSKTFDSSCRNHGSCPYCENGRTFFDKSKRVDADMKITEYLHID